MDEEILDQAQSPSGEQIPSTEDSKSLEDLQKVYGALEKERKLREDLEKKYKKAAEKEREFEGKLKQYQAINPEHYEKLKQMESERQEQELIKRQQFEDAKKKYLTEAETAKRESMKWQERYENTILENSIKSAFYANGGQRVQIDVEAGLDDLAPVDAILNILRPRTRYQDGRVVLLDKTGEIELNSEGKPKSVTEKMMEIKKTSLANLFDPENNARGSGMTPTTRSADGKTIKVFSREAARSGRASIDDIANGKAYLQ